MHSLDSRKKDPQMSYKRKLLLNLKTQRSYFVGTTQVYAITKST